MPDLPEESPEWLPIRILGYLTVWAMRYMTIPYIVFLGWVLVRRIPAAPATSPAKVALAVTYVAVLGLTGILICICGWWIHTSDRRRRRLIALRSAPPVRSSD